MKIRFRREAMLTAFSTAAAVAPSRSPKTILQQVRLSVKGETVTLAATDLEMGVTVHLREGAQVEGEGEAMLPVDRFSMILRESSDDEMSLAATPSGMEVKGQRNRFKLGGENPDEFPQVPQFQADAYHELPARLWREMVRRTLFATDTESSRYALGGVLLEFEPKRIVAVGTDGRRLAKMEGPATAVNGHGSTDRVTIVPTRAMQLIERSLSDGDAVVKIASRANDILVQTPTAEYFSRLVEGRFPRWRDVLPEKPSGEKIQLTVGPTHSTVRQAAIVASNESRGVNFSFGDGALVLAAVTADVGEARVELPIDYQGPELTVKLDHRFVTDFLRVLPAETVFRAYVQGGDAPALFTTDDGYEYVLMPMAND